MLMYMTMNIMIDIEGRELAKKGEALICVGPYGRAAFPAYAFVLRHFSCSQLTPHLPYSHIDRNKTIQSPEHTCKLHRTRVRHNVRTICQAMGRCLHFNLQPRLPSSEVIIAEIQPEKIGAISIQRHSEIQSGKYLSIL